jgi:Mrp family chromosome partitioning ATPase
MSRIFDAIRKSRASEGPAPAPAMPAYAVPHGPPAGSSPRPDQPLLPLAGSVDLDGDVLQQMTQLRVTLESQLPDRATRTVMFMSAQGGEGTTTVAHQFAWSLARDRDLRVVLMDVCAKAPTLEADPVHRVMVARLDAGVSAAASAARLPDVAMNLRGCAVPAEFRASGIYPAGAAREVVEATIGSADWIVVDGPPVLASPDAPTLAAVADATLLVVQSGFTRQPVLARSLSLLRTAGARIVGSVLNRRRLEIPEFLYRRL